MCAVPLPQISSNNGSPNSHSISLVSSEGAVQRTSKKRYYKVLKMLSLGSPLIKDTLTKTILMRKQQLWCSLQTIVWTSQHTEAFITLYTHCASCKGGSILTKHWRAIRKVTAPRLPWSHGATSDRTKLEEQHSCKNHCLSL